MTLPTETPPDNGQELITLTRMLRRSRGKFALAFARCNSPAGRQVLVERLREALNAAEISFQEVTLNTTENIVAQLQGVPGQDEGQPVFIYGIEFLLPSDRDHHATLAQLNERREKFQKLARPLIFWLPEFALQEIATKASDFWAWRSGVYRFEIETAMRLEDYRVATGDELWRVSNFSEEEKNARLNLLQGLEQDYSEDDPTSLIARGRIYHRIGFLYESMGNLENAMQYYQKSSAIAQNSGNLRGWILNINAIANIFNIRGNLEHAMQLYRESLKISEGLGEIESRAVAMYGISEILYTRGELDDAMQYSQAALEIEENLGNLQGQVSILSSMARTFVLRGELKQAMTLYQKSLEIAETLNSPFHKSAILNQMANLLMSQRQPDQAEKLYLQSLEIIGNLGNPQATATLLNNLANIYIYKGDLERAMQFSIESLKLRESMGDLLGKATALHAIAGIFVERGELEQAATAYQESLAIKHNLGDLKGKADTLAMLAQVDALQGNYRQALSELIEAKQIVTEMGAVLRVQSCEKNIIILKSITPPDIFPALWTEVTGEETLPEWLMEQK